VVGETLEFLEVTALMPEFSVLEAQVAIHVAFALARVLTEGHQAVLAGIVTYAPYMPYNV